MKARNGNPMRAMVAAMVMTMTAATLASAAPAGRSTPNAPRDPRVNARVVAQYGEGSWLAPAAVVLKSEREWDEWNDGEVANGRSVGKEKAPNGVAWGREVLLVVVLGENLNSAMNVKLNGAMRKGSATEVSLELTAGHGGSAPSVVVALPRSAAHDVKLLTNLLLPELPQRATAYELSNGGNDPLPIMASWGSLKADYR